VVRLGKYAHSKQRAIPTQTLQFHVKFMYMACWFSIYRVYFFNIRFGCGPKSGKSLDAETEEKLVKIYRLCRAEKDNHLNLVKLFDLFFFFFQVL